MLNAEIKNILSQVAALKANPSAENALPQNSFYLQDGRIIGEMIGLENGEKGFASLNIT